MNPNDDRSGVECLRRAIDDIVLDMPAEALTPPSRGSNESPRARRPRRVTRGRAWALAVAAVLAVLAAGVYFTARQPGIAGGSPGSAEMGIEFVELEIRGQVVTSRVIDARGAGSIVVLPQGSPASTRRAGPVAVLGGRP